MQAPTSGARLNDSTRSWFRGSRVRRVSVRTQAIGKLLSFVPRHQPESVGLRLEAIESRGPGGIGGTSATFL